MTLQHIHSPRFAIVLVAAVLCFANVAQAGPPLICHTIEIGQAKSLPWISHNWNLSGGENYDTKNLVRDTLEILSPSTPVLVRMETLRRATLYARKDPVAAKELLARLHARATSAESSGHADALAWFDAGYLAETYKQWIGQNLPHMSHRRSQNRFPPGPKPRKPFHWSPEPDYVGNARKELALEVTCTRHDDLARPSTQSGSGPQLGSPLRGECV